MMTRRLLWGIVGGATILRIIVATFLPLTPDEAYYWVWSQHLQAGYLDHPPMVAVWIRLGTWCIGHHPLGVRLFGVLASVGASIALVFAGRNFWPKLEKAGERATCLLNVTLMFGVGMACMTPDTPLLFFTVLTLWALSSALKAPRALSHNVWWGVTGIFLGLAGASKYTAVFLALGIVGYVLFGRRHLWRRLGPWLGGFLALLVVMPVLWWNEAHQWVSFAKQGGRAGVWHPTRAFQFLGELWAGQIGLMTPLVFVSVLIAVWSLVKKRDVPVLLWCLIPGSIFFLLHACGDRVQANWLSVLYPVCVLIAGGVGAYWRVAASSGAILCVLVSIQALWQPLPLPAHWNPIVRQTAGWEAFVHQVEQMAAHNGAQAVATEDYALASILAFYRHDHARVIMSQDSRWAYYGGRPLVAVPHVLMVQDASYRFLGDDIIVRRTQKGQVVRGYHLGMYQQLIGRVIP